MSDEICGDLSPRMGASKAFVYTCTLQPRHNGPHRCRDDLGSIAWGLTAANIALTPEDEDA